MWVSSHTDVAPAADFTSVAPCLPGLPAWRRVITWKIPTVYRKESRPGAERPVDERKPFGFPLIPSCYRHRFGGRLHAGRDYVCSATQTSLRVAIQISPNRIPEGEQTRRGAPGR